MNTYPENEINMGLSATDRMKKDGIAAKKGSVLLVPIDDVFIPPPGHPLSHPRGFDPIDEELAADITEKAEIEKNIVVRDDGIGPDGRRRLTLLDGARRTVNGREAQRRLRESGALKADEPFYVGVDLFTGDDLAFIIARLSYNTDPLKKSDSPSVLARTVIQLFKLKATAAQILPVMPRTIDLVTLEAMREWDNLMPEVVSAFEAGAPIGLLRAVLDAPREEQSKRLSYLTDAGMSTMKGATRLLNKDKRAASAKVDDVTVPPPNAMKAPSSDLPKPGSTAKGERVHPKTLSKIIGAVESLMSSEDALDSAESTDEIVEMSVADGFVLGIQYALGEVVLHKLPKAIQERINTIMSAKAGK